MSRGVTSSTSRAACGFAAVASTRTECEHFVQSIRTGSTPISDGEAGLRVVRVLEALQQSLDETRRNGVARSVALTG